MKEDVDFVSRVKKTVLERMEKAVKEGKARVGEHPGEIPVSPRQQMAAYDAMTAEDMMAMMQKMGLSKFNEYVGEMEMRKRRMKNANLPS